LKRAPFFRVASKAEGFAWFVAAYLTGT